MTENVSAGNCTGPYATESLAVKAGLVRIATMLRPGPNKIALIVFTDSQGLITAMQKGPVRQRDAQLAAIWNSLYTIHQKGVKRVTFHWIPAHCGVLRNESAGTAALQALNMFGPITQRRVPVRYQNIVTYYKEKNKNHYLSSLQLAQSTRSKLTTLPANLRHDNTLGRRSQTKLAQLRTGVCNTMGWCYTN